MAQPQTQQQLSESIMHWAEFGAKRDSGNQPSNLKRMTSTDRGTNPFQKPVTSNWNLAIPRPELPKILMGFEPQDMDDKWFVYTKGPDAQGVALVHMHRSWTGNKSFELKLVVEPTDGSEQKKDDGDAHFTAITWESVSGAWDEEEAKRIAKGVCQWCLDVQLPQE